MSPAAPASAAAARVRRARFLASMQSRDRLHRIPCTDFGDSKFGSHAIGPDRHRHSPLIPASRITLSHLFCSDTISLPNSAELIFTTAPPCSASFF